MKKTSRPVVLISHVWISFLLYYHQSSGLGKLEMVAQEQFYAISNHSKLLACISSETFLNSAGKRLGHYKD